MVAARGYNGIVTARCDKTMRFEDHKSTEELPAGRVERAWNENQKSKCARSLRTRWRVDGAEEFSEGGFSNPKRIASYR